jgi:hypothetical protein
MDYWKGKYITSLEPNEIFCFGSNPQGWHGKGASLFAKRFGATTGIGRGLSIQTYAIVTKNLKRNFYEQSTGILYSKAGEKSVSIRQIRNNIVELYQFARKNPDKRFLIAYTYEEENNKPKKLLCGYTCYDIICMFITSDKSIPDNIVFHISFKPIIEKLYLSKNKQ